MEVGTLIGKSNKVDALPMGDTSMMEFMRSHRGRDVSVTTTKLYLHKLEGTRFVTQTATKEAPAFPLLRRRSK